MINYDKEEFKNFYLKETGEKLTDKEIKETEKSLFLKLTMGLTKNKNGVCPTLTANMGTGGHNVPIIRDKLGIRKLTPRECARIQGYRDTFKLPLGLIADSQIYKQLGNSVPVPLVQRIATEMLKALT